MRSRSPRAAFAWARMLSAQNGDFAGLERKLPGNVKLPVQMKVGHIIGKRGSDLRKNQVKGLQPGFDITLHRLCSANVLPRPSAKSDGSATRRPEPLSASPVGAKNLGPRS
jgi:hypothetical protein